MFNKKWFLTVFLSLCLCFLVFAADGETSVISIESAQKTEYKKDPVTGSDTIVLTGGVRISVSRGSTKTTILADMVNYNRETDMMYAEGNVALEQTGSKAGGEKVTAKSLLFNTATLEGIFDNGRVVQTQSDALNLPSGSTLNVASTIFGRDSGGTIAFKNGELTFCDDEDPHWKIRARRIWLLPGGEFAFFSALLYVGHVPLLYFPAFYYPKDELIFNPAFGYRNREGYYINNTFYLIGRKPQNAKSTAETNKVGSSSTDNADKINFFSLMKTNGLKEQKREGLVLHNLDKDYSGDTSKYLKLMADYYANLGVMVGLDGVFKPNELITSLEGKIQLGWSNSIFHKGSDYLPYAASGERYSDSSNFMGMKTPFRYMGNFKMSIAKPFPINISMPMYSDPYFNYDFNNRAETMDWIDFLMSSPTTNTDTPSISEISSFTWQVDGSYTFKLPDALSPFISSLSISSVSTSLEFASQNNTTLNDTAKKTSDGYQEVSPERKFYYPSKITPFKSSARVSGTIIQYPLPERKSTVGKISVSMKPPKDLDTSEKKDEKDEKSDSEKKDEEKKKEEPEKYFTDTALPSLSATIPSQTSFSGITYKLGYSISPDFTSQFSYASTNLKTPEDFKWNDIESMYYQIKAPTTITSNLGYRDSFVSLSDTFTFEPAYQDHPYLKELDSAGTNGGKSASEIKSQRNTDYSARKLDLTNSNALSVRPFYYTKYFSETSLTWNTTLKMVRTKYISEDPNEPAWEYLTGDVTDSESLTVHNLNLVLAAKEGDFSQKLSLTSTLPPQVDKYTGTFSLGFPYTTFSIGTGVHRKSKDDETWVKENVSQSLSLSLLNSKLKLSQSWTYNSEEQYHESLKFSLSGYGAQLAYTMSYTSSYDFVTGSGWIANGEKDFQPYNVSLAYATPSKTFSYWTNRISFAPSLSTSVVYDCVRPTNSYFKFIPAITFKINNFLNITLSAESRNSVIYRYFCPDDKYEEYYRSSGERSIFTDLIDSFRFDDESKRKSSGFKLQSFNIKVTHELHDWNLSADFSIKPRYVTSSTSGFDSSRNSGSPYYDFSPYFSISVVWRPLEGMKTQVVDEYGEWKLNP